MLRLTIHPRMMIAACVFLAWASARLCADDKDLLPPRLPKDQRENLQRFLQEHGKPDRYVPADAKVVDAQPADVEPKTQPPAGQPVKQYMVQITQHRPVPGQEDVKRVDIYYYRPNPEKGKPGITIKYTVDLTNGKQVGQTEVLAKQHTPISREELAEAVALARANSPDVQAIYKGRDAGAVHWEFLQVMIQRKTEQYEPGDRAVRLVFTAMAKDQPSPPPVVTIVNLTKGTVKKEER